MGTPRRVRLTTVTSTMAKIAAKKTAIKAKKVKDPNAPKRPLSAYMFFAKDQRADFEEESVVRCHGRRQGARCAVGEDDGQVQVRSGSGQGQEALRSGHGQVQEVDWRNARILAIPARARR